jgi:Spy/CpxP family protein refolding chaperone
LGCAPGKGSRKMLKKLIPLFMAGILFTVAICFAEDEIQNKNNPDPFLNDHSLEWSNYGLNFEWSKDKELLKEMDLTAHQEEELNKLFNEASQTVKMEEDTRIYEKKLKEQIQITDFMVIQGRNNQPDLAEIDSLITQINELRSQQYKIKMSLKAKLRILLSEKQRNTLYYHFIKKEAAQKEKMKEKMGDGEGRKGGFGGRGGRGGRSPF